MKDNTESRLTRLRNIVAKDDGQSLLEFLALTLLLGLLAYVAILQIAAKFAKYGGFTLIEVLAVMGIVGLLAAIAIPQIGKFRERAYVFSLKSDARMIVNEAESVHTDVQAYPGQTGAPTSAVFLDGLSLSPSNTVTWGSASEAGVTFTITNSKAAKTLQVTDNKLGAVS